MKWTFFGTLRTNEVEHLCHDEMKSTKVKFTTKLAGFSLENDLTFVDIDGFLLSIYCFAEIRNITETFVPKHVREHFVLYGFRLRLIFQIRISRRGSDRFHSKMFSIFIVKLLIKLIHFGFSLKNLDFHRQYQFPSISLRTVSENLFAAKIREPDTLQSGHDSKW